MARHVHIGAGKLGLGLIVPKSLGLGCFEVTIVAALGKPSVEYLDKTRVVRVDEHDTGKSEKYSGFDVLTYDRESDGGPVSELIADPNTHLVTLAVTRENLFSRYSKNGVPPVVGVVARGLCRRPAEAPRLTLLACENAEDNAKLLRDDLFDKILHEEADDASEAAGILDAVAISETLVDRICQEPQISEECLVVPSESYAEWNILAGNQAPALVAIGNSCSAKKLGVPSLLSPDDFEVRRSRKLWGFNGTDLLLAIHAHRLGIRYVRQAFDDPVGELLAKAFGYITSLAVMHLQQERGLTPNFSSALEYVQRVSQRIRANDTETSRVIKEILKVLDQKGKLPSWTAKVRQRIIDPLVRFFQVNPEFQILLPGQRDIYKPLVQFLALTWAELDDAAKAVSMR